MSKKLIIYIIASIVILGIGVTYAWITWGSEENTAVEFTIANVADVKFYEGTNITSNDLAPTLTYEKGESLEFSVSVRNTEDYYINITMTSEVLSQELREESLKYSIFKESELVAEGNFSNINEGEKKIIGSRIEVGEGLTNFKIYIWIDGNMDNPLDMRNKNMKLTFNVEASGPLITDTSGANTPELFEGMIPIKWDSNNTVVKADGTNPGDNNWYNYQNKQWANAVMVSSGTRDTYMDAEVGTTINTSDILAYWIWIPRYSYQLFNAGFTAGTSPQTINIVFESASTEKSEGTTNGEWLTHPAFSFGTEEEGYIELSGFWVAKFESTGDAVAGNLTVLPGVTSLRNITVGAMYTASQLFSNTAYLTETGINQVDSHMMKNTEWGAVAYLSHSIYGKNEEITINNNGGTYYTGGSSGNAYITNVGQSTTGNVYGIYDMSGNAYEYVMGNYNKTAGSSGLTVTGINGKYVDIYTGTTVASSIRGDAAGETAEWYGDYARFINSSGPWFVRSGGGGVSSDIIGIFYFNSNYGSGDAQYAFTFRPVLSAK